MARRYTYIKGHKFYLQGIEGERGERYKAYKCDNCGAMHKTYSYDY